MRIIFLSFADKRLYRSLRRIGNQASSLGLFSSILLYNEEDLAESFRNRYSQVLDTRVRGFGYWIWKPQIIKQVLSEIDEGDMICYVDSGCHINENGIDIFKQYLSMVCEDKLGILAFKDGVENVRIVNDSRELFIHKDSDWTKGDLLDYFSVRDSSLIYEGTYGAGIIFLRKNKFVIEFIDTWIKAYQDDFTNIDDTPSKSNNLDGFIEHRHDQSIFSILCKLNNVTYRSSLEYWFPSKNNINKPDWNALKKYPIHAKRDKDYGSKINFINFCKRAFKKIEKMFHSSLWKIFNIY